MASDKEHRESVFYDRRIVVYSAGRFLDRSVNVSGIICDVEDGLSVYESASAFGLDVQFIGVYPGAVKAL